MKKLLLVYALAFSASVGAYSWEDLKNEKVEMTGYELALQRLNFVADMMNSTLERREEDDTVEVVVYEKDGLLGFSFNFDGYSFSKSAACRNRLKEVNVIMDNIKSDFDKIFPDKTRSEVVALKSSFVTEVNIYKKGELRKTCGN